MSKFETAMPGVDETENGDEMTKPKEVKGEPKPSSGLPWESFFKDPRAHEGFRESGLFGPYNEEPKAEENSDGTGKKLEDDGEHI